MVHFFVKRSAVVHRQVSSRTVISTDREVTRAEDANDKRTGADDTDCPLTDLTLDANSFDEALSFQLDRHRKHSRPLCMMVFLITRVHCCRQAPSHAHHLVHGALV